ncbi:MAG: lipopolysaccharide biosynthesis protein [Hyphomicrobiales bacterium]
MKIDNKQFLKTSLIYTLVGAFSPLLNLLIQPAVEGNNLLNADEFAYIGVGEIIFNIIFILCGYSMNNAIARYYYDFEDDPSQFKKMVSGIFNSVIFRGILIAVLMFLFGSWAAKFIQYKEMHDFSSYGYYLLLIGLNMALIQVASAFFRNKKAVLAFSLINLGVGLFRGVFQVISVLFFDTSFIGYFQGSAIGGTIITIILYIYLIKTYKFYWFPPSAREIYRFSTPLVQYSIIVWAQQLIEKYFLIQNADPTLFAIYNNALKFALGIQMVLQALQGASQPEIFRLMKDGINKNKGEIRKLCNMLIVQTQLIIAFTIIPAMIFNEFFYETEIKLAAGIIAIVFIRYVFRTQIIIFGFPIYFMKKTKAFLYINTISIVILIICNYYLVPRMGYYGAITGAFISMTFQTLAIYYYQNKISPIGWNLKKILYYPLALVGITIILEIVKYYTGINAYITSGIITLLIFLSILIQYNKELKEFTLKKLRK